MTTLDRALLVAAFVGCLTFCGLYAWRSAWWTSEHGQNLMAFMGCLCVLLGLSVASLVLGPGYPGARPIGRACFIALVGVIWWRVILLVRTQRRR